METKIETSQDRLAIMRWENETGPTAGKNQRPGKGATARTAAKSTTATGKRNIIQGKLQKIPIVGMAVARTGAAPGGLKKPRRV